MTVCADCGGVLGGMVHSCENVLKRRELDIREAELGRWGALLRSDALRHKPKLPEGEIVGSSPIEEITYPSVQWRERKYRVSTSVRLGDILRELTHPSEQRIGEYVIETDQDLADVRAAVIERMLQDIPS